MTIRPVRLMFGRGAGHGESLWPVLVLLAAVVLVPTACLLWFMSRAMSNERLAVRQRLTEAYASQLAKAREDLERNWAKTAVELDRCSFPQCVSTGLADSVILYDTRGRLVYPAPGSLPTADPSANDPEWVRARRLEERNDPVAAAGAYGAIADRATDASVTARALQAQARCLVRAGKKEAAIGLILDRLSQNRFRSAVDLQGRAIAADGELMALQLMGTREHAGFRETAKRLHGRIADYDNPALGAAQRLFLMKQFQTHVPQPENGHFSTLDAEDLAARFVERTARPSREPMLRVSELPGIWQFSSASGRVIALFRAETLPGRMTKLFQPPPGARMAALPPGKESEAFQSVPAGPHLPGWRLVLSLDDPHLFDDAAERQIAVYLWTGILGLVAVSILAAAVIRRMRRQARLAQLKNDLIATVSHELKTPLASIRLLVDTLVDGSHPDAEKTREYLLLIARENARLSRLIENFLAFSRMEQNRQTFDRGEVAPREIVNSAADAVRERFQSSGCRFTAEAAPDLPKIVADPDAMVTVLVNLLDNAYKYSGDDRIIHLRAVSGDGTVCFAVSDNGIGLAPREAKRVFEPFYQADRRLSRKTGGCGLGLSIVRFIVTSHGGTISVSSKPGEGSTFSVSIPAAMERGSSVDAR